MSILAKLTGKKQGGKLENAIIAIIGLESQLATKRTELDSAKKRLQDRFQRSILAGEKTASHPGYAEEIIAKQAEIEAISELISEATTEALILAKEEKKKVEAGEADFKTRKMELLKEKNRKILIAAAELARRFGGLSLEPPEKNNAGKLLLPGLLIDKEEIQETLAHIPPVQPDETIIELQKLDKEMVEMMTCLGNPVELWLNSLLEKARKQAA